MTKLGGRGLRQSGGITRVGDKVKGLKSSSSKDSPQQNLPRHHFLHHHFRRSLPHLTQRLLIPPLPIMSADDFVFLDVVSTYT
jgi:hypothetical protein